MPTRHFRTPGNWIHVHERIYAPHRLPMDDAHPQIRRNDGGDVEARAAASAVPSRSGATKPSRLEPAWPSGPMTWSHRCTVILERICCGAWRRNASLATYWGATWAPAADATRTCMAWVISTSTSSGSCRTSRNRFQPHSEPPWPSNTATSHGLP